MQIPRGTGTEFNESIENRVKVMSEGKQAIHHDIEYRNWDVMLQQYAVVEYVQFSSPSQKKVVMLECVQHEDVTETRTRVVRRN